MLRTRHDHVLQGEGGEDQNVQTEEVQDQNVQTDEVQGGMERWKNYVAFSEWGASSRGNDLTTHQLGESMVGGKEINIWEERR